MCLFTSRFKGGLFLALTLIHRKRARVSLSTKAPCKANGQGRTHPGHRCLTLADEPDTSSRVSAVAHWNARRVAAPDSHESCDYPGLSH